MRVSIVVIVFGALLGWTGSSAFADVTGELTVQIGLFPEATQTEAVKFAIDFELLSDIDITVSGLTLGHRFAIGVTGIEHSILTVRGTLGAVDVLDEIVFATPFSNQIPDDIDGDGLPNTSDPDIDGDGLANLSDPTPFGAFSAFIKTDIDGDGVPNGVDPDIDGDGVANDVDPTPFGTNFLVTPLMRPIGPTLFVKKRVTTTLNFAGVTITNLGIFEDVNFLHPFSGAVQTYGASFQDLRFGDIFTVLGQTVSGINIRSVTGIGADPDKTNVVKKASFSGSICDNLTDFAFCVEQLFIDNVQLGSLTLNSRTEFRILPLTLAQTFTLNHPVIRDVLDLNATLQMNNLLELTPVSASLFLDATPVTVTLNMDSTFQVTSAFAQAQLDLGGASFTTSVLFIPNTGVSTVGFGLSVTDLDGLSLFANTTLSNPGAGVGGGFGSHSTSFTLSGQVTENLGVNATMTFTQDGLSSAQGRIIFKF